MTYQDHLSALGSNIPPSPSDTSLSSSQVSTSSTTSSIDLHLRLEALLNNTGSENSTHLHINSHQPTVDNTLRHITTYPILSETTSIGPSSSLQQFSIESDDTSLMETEYREQVLYPDYAVEFFDTSSNPINAPRIEIVIPNSLRFPSDRTIDTQQSIDSDSTITETESTPPREISITGQPYNNPRYLGSMQFYYPPRYQNPINSQTMLETPTDPPMESSANISEIPETLIEDSNQESERHFVQSTLQSCWDVFQSSCDSLKSNERWGDDISVKKTNSTRIYFQNVNRCSLSINANKWETIVEAMKLAECDVSNFVQTGINWKIRDIQDRMKQTLSLKMPVNKLNVSQNKHFTEQSFLPGGTAQVLQGDWTGRVAQYIHDPRRMGRWCGVKLRLKCERHLYIICAYRVCNQQTSQIGSETAYNQQYLMLSIEGMVNPDPRKVFIQDLIRCVKKWKADMDEVLIVLDANEHLGESQYGLTHLMRECGLVDMFHQHHGTCPEFTTYDCGSKRLDYALGTTSLLPFVLQCGYLPFYQGIQSDHRGLFLDFSNELIDGLTRIERVPSRYLNSAYTKDVYRYKQQVIKDFNTNNIIEKALYLFNMAGPEQSNNTEYLDRLNQLDKIVTSIQLLAEKKCCKRRTKYDWSDDIHFTKIIITYWNIMRKIRIHNIDTNNVAKQIYDSLPEEYRQYIDIASKSYLNNWRNSKKKLRFLMVQHRAEIAKTQRTQHDNEAMYTGSTAEKVAMKYERRKKDKKLYQTLKHHFHPISNSGITHLIVPDKDIEGQETTNADTAHTWKTVMNPDDVLTNLLERNIRHFGQAEGTPFTTSPLVDMFGYSGMTDTGINLIQDGTIPPGIEGTCMYSQSVVQRLSDTTRRPHECEEMLTLDNFTAAINKWRESTSTSPSGKHLGHYKSLLVIDDHSNEYNMTNRDPGPIILEVLFHLAAAAFSSGLTLDRWKKITTCMIEKIPGVPKINKLRVIHLYEADYNALNKIVWQRGVVWQAHQQGKLNPAQHGSRPHRTCIEVVISKDQKYLNSALTRIPMATMDNDAKSCYDRIVASLALLTSNYFRVPVSICASVGETLKTMQFHIRTAMGDSDASYSHNLNTPIHGVGQGGTASPAFWLLVSSLLIDCYQDKAKGMTMRDPSKSLMVQQWIEALVDDTSIFTNLDQGNDVHELVRSLELDTQHWEKLLSVSGGCLELNKCFYYILAWMFNEKGIPIPQSLTEIREATRDVTVQEFGKQTGTVIATKRPSEAHKTLGVWKTMDGNVIEQLKVLQIRSRNMATIVATSGMYPYQTDVALRMIYTTSMCYSLPAVNIPEKALDKIQYKALESFVPALGFNQGFPRAVILGPTAFGGEGVPHLYTESKLQQIEIMIMHIRAKTELGTLFIINLRWIQLHAGISVPYLESTCRLPHINNWFTGIREFLIQIQGKLIIKDIPTPILERSGDKVIMEEILRQMPELSGNQICYINAWRLFFQVQTVSDIATATGDHILSMYLQFPQHDDISDIRKDRTPKFSWPIQPYPSSRMTFKLWVRCLRTCFTDQNSSRLRARLRHWCVSPSQSLSSWQAYTNPSYNKLIVLKDTEYIIYSNVLKRTACTTTYHTAPFDIITSIPDDYFPITLHIEDNHVTAQHDKIKINVRHSISDAAAPITCIQEAISRSEDLWEKQMLQHFRIYDLQKLHLALQDVHTPIIAVSDGAHKSDRGSFGVAVGTEYDDLYQIEGPAPYTEEHTTPFRSEAYGMLANIRFLSLVIGTYGIKWETPRKIQIYCDNISLVKIMNRLLYQTNSPRIFLYQDADVLTQILFDMKNLIHNNNVLILCLHVKGHQDRKQPYEMLDRPAQLNVQAHNFAQNYQLNGTRTSYSEFTNNPVSLCIIDDIITDDIKTHIRNASRSQNIRAYMIDKFEWAADIPDLIWWKVHGTTIQLHSHPDRRRLRKYIFRWLPTCERLNLQNPESCEPSCQSCKAPIETHHHVLCCPCNKRQLMRDVWFVQLDGILSNLRYTPTIVRRIIFNKITAYCTLTSPPEILLETLHVDIQVAYRQQSRIGWAQLLNGRLAIGWRDIISCHLHHKKVPDSEMNANLWGEIVIKHFFQLVLQSWHLRNEEAHIINSNNESRLTKQRLLSKIQAMQDSSPNIRYCDRDFVYKEIALLTTYSLSNLRAWHRAALSIIKANKHRNSSARANSTQTTIQQHFSVRPPAAPNLSDIHPTTITSTSSIVPVHITVSGTSPVVTNTPS